MRCNVSREWVHQFVTRLGNDVGDPSRRGARYAAVNRAVPRHEKGPAGVAGPLSQIDQIEAVDMVPCGPTRVVGDQLAVSDLARPITGELPLQGRSFLSG